VCGRLNIQATQLTKLLMSILQEPYPGEDNANAAPTETLPVIRMGDAGQLECVPMRWWLTPSWSQGPSTQYSMFNAKVETAATSPAFKGPFVRRRCVLPVSGFYEWQRRNGPKQPFLITDEDADGLLLAGLWDAWQPRGSAGDAAQLLSFTLLTTAAHPSLAALHHRQPVFLRQDQALQWLDPNIATQDLGSLLAPSMPVPLQVVPVSSEVNNARNKSDRCHYPVGPTQLVRADMPYNPAPSASAVEGRDKHSEQMTQQESIIVDT
jgi:putative SOS response-associated peptidase YedK